MEVILYKNFSKRRNSTKQVTVDGTEKEVYLKDTCSVTNPKFFISDVAGYNYLKAWNMYYFIDSIKYDINGAQYIECSLDVLGTWKAQIQATSAFVKYSSSNYDVNVIDDRIVQKITSYPQESDVTFTVAESPFWLEEPVAGDNNGCYIITCATSVSGQTVYALERSTLDSLIADITTMSLTDISTKIQMYFGDALHSIQGLRYIPIRRRDLKIEAISTILYLGDYIPGDAQGSALAATLLKTPRYSNTVDIEIPWVYQDFRRYSGFTHMYLILPYVGKVNIDPLEIIGETELSIEVQINVVTGSGVYIVSRGSDEIPIAQYNFSCGHEIPIAVMSMNAEGFVSGVLEGGEGVVGSAATPDMIPKKRGKHIRMEENPVATGDVNNVMSGFAKATLACFEKTSTIIGSYGGGYGEYGIRQYYMENVSRHSRTDPDELTSLYGRPCGKVLQISTLTGYVQTEGFSIDIAAIGEIKDAINELMDSGVYLE